MHFEPNCDRDCICGSEHLLHLFMINSVTDRACILGIQAHASVPAEVTINLTALVGRTRPEYGNPLPSKILRVFLALMTQQTRHAHICSVSQLERTSTGMQLLITSSLGDRITNWLILEPEADSRIQWCNMQVRLVQFRVWRWWRGRVGGRPCEARISRTADGTNVSSRG